MASKIILDLFYSDKVVLGGDTFTYVFQSSQLDTYLKLA